MKHHLPSESSRWICLEPHETLIRIASPAGTKPAELPAGVGRYWHDSVDTGSADCWLVGSDRSALAALPAMIASALPIIVAFDCQGYGDADIDFPAPLRGGPGILHRGLSVLSV
jgi:hypothetical protein